MAGQLEYSATPATNTAVNGIGITGSSSLTLGDDAIRQIMADSASAITRSVTKAAGTYSAAKADYNQFWRATGAVTINLAAAATLTDGWGLWVKAEGGDVLIDPSSSEQINGANTLTLVVGQSARIVCTGTAFFAIVFGEGQSSAGHLYGLTLSNNASDATNDIDIAVGSAASSDTTPSLMILASALTKRLDAAWAVGTNQGGLDTGSIANTTYHVWLIQRSDTGVVDALFSTSATSPTMPANYDRKRRVGSILREAGSIVLFFQHGNLFRRVVLATDRNSTAAAATALLALSVPAGLVTAPLMTVRLAANPAPFIIEVGVSSAEDGGAITPVNIISAGAGDTQQDSIANVLPIFFTNTSRQIYFRQINSVGTPATSTLQTLGWIDVNL